MIAESSTNSAPKIKRRIFLSYPHDECRELAYKVRDDLERRGHEVWFDEDHLLPGLAWEEHIEKGLDWGRGQRQARMPGLADDPALGAPARCFCLNEITRAVQMRIDILPTMVVEVAPPLSICRIQWLDLKDCAPIDEHAAQYDVKFGVLLRALESARSTTMACRPASSRCTGPTTTITSSEGRQR